MNAVKIRNNKVGDYMRANPDVTDKDICELFSLTRNVVNGIRRTVEGRRRKDYIKSENDEIVEYIAPTGNPNIQVNESDKLSELLNELNLDSHNFDFKKGFVRKRNNGNEDLYTSYVEFIPKYTPSPVEENDFLSKIKEIFSNTPIHPKKEKTPYGRDKSLAVYISDVHVGARVDGDCLYDNDYNMSVIIRRSTQLIDEIISLHEIHKFDEIVLFNLGDSMDGNMGKTSRGGHDLPQNLNGKEQFLGFIEMMRYIIDSLYANSDSKIRYISVGTSNHSGFEEFMVNKAIEMYITSKYNGQIPVVVSDKSIDSIQIQENTIIFLHGKDEMSQKYSFPATLDTKTDLYFTDYVLKNSLYNPDKNIHIRKGDLHHYAFSEGKLFDYVTVRSFFGGNRHSSANYGSTKAGVDMEVFSKDKNSMRYTLMF